MTEYEITVKTGDLKYSGTDANVSIQIIGENAESSPTTLDHFFHNDFEQGTADVFKVKMEDIGDPVLCKFRKYKSPKIASILYFYNEFIFYTNFLQKIFYSKFFYTIFLH